MGLDTELQHLSARCIGEQIRISAHDETDRWSIDGTLVAIRHRGTGGDGKTRVEIELGDQTVRLKLPATHHCSSSVEPDLLDPRRR